MKKSILSLLLSLFCAFGTVACFDNAGVGSSFTGESPAQQSNVTAAAETNEFIDYAGQATLDLSAETQTIEVTVKTFVDGDTTHFNATGFPEDLLKARYVAVNTPESTGKIEEWGKKAARFTRSKLESATSIIIESDSDHWETDSTGDRYLSWVWYKAPGSTTYRNLNLELLQEGLALASKSGESRYGTLATPAIAQAQAFKLNVYSGEKDPDFFYGESIELDLKELRINIESYSGKRVAFEGVVAYYINQGVYVENFDEETQMYFGIYVYYGFFLDSSATKILAIGNKVRISGVVQYYEAGDSYQVSDLKYNQFRPGADDIQLISKNNPVSNTETSTTTFNSKVTITTDDGEKQYKYAELAMNTSISMKNLYVQSAYTTQSGNNEGAMTLTCKADGKTVKVRTIVLKDKAGNVATEDMLVGKTIDVMGVVDYFSGDYQVKILSLGGIKVDGGPLFPPTEPNPPTSSSSEEEPKADNSWIIIVVAVAVVVVIGVAVAVVLIKNGKEKHMNQTVKTDDDKQEE